MAVYIREYADMAVAYGKAMPVGSEPSALAADQKLTNSGTSAPSAAFNANTNLVCVHTDAIISIVFGVTVPTATTGHLRMAADTTMFFGVRPGTYLAVITNT